MKRGEAALELAERFDLPPESMSGAAKVTVTGRRRVMVEYHRGLLEYTPELIVVNTARGRVRILGNNLTLRGMDRDTLVLTGKVTAVEYE